MNHNLQPILENDLVFLKPLSREDFKDLFKVASDPLIWEQHQNKDRHTTEAFNQFFDEACESNGALIILDKKSDKIIGSSRFRIIDESRGVVEIGWSFLGREYWGGRYNQEFKKLMVNHALKAFSTVIFYVNSQNYRSQRALEKLGALKINDLSKSWVLPLDKGITFYINKPLP